MSPARLLLAPDKFRGTATASELIALASKRAAGFGWSIGSCLVADGGEGLLDAFGGEPRVSRVTGPLGAPVDAEWRTITNRHHQITAVIEMARASGLGLVDVPTDSDSYAATTTGTGELIRAAIEYGATTIIVGCGGSATSDGGRGAIEVIGGLLPNKAINVIVACDVTTTFIDAARIYAAQKGATPATIVAMTNRLSLLASYYVDHYGVDVTNMERSGAAGGLAGGLAAVGAKLVSGFDLVAQHTGLDELIAGADLVVTGEGRLDHSSLSGKVVGELLKRCHGHTELLIICGEVADDVDDYRLRDATIVSLSERFGNTISFDKPAWCFAEALVTQLARYRPDGPIT